MKDLLKIIFILTLMYFLITTAKARAVHSKVNPLLPVDNTGSVQLGMHIVDPLEPYELSVRK